MSGNAVASTPEGAGKRTLLTIRLVAAVVQAAALYLLFHSAVQPVSWPAADPRWFDPLLLVAIYLPLIIMLGVSEIPWRALLPWAAIAAVVLAGLGRHAATRNPAALPDFVGLVPLLRFWFAISAAVFIAQVLVVDLVSERRLCPRYTRHFATAWKQGVQVALTGVFAAVFWLLLHLGAGLFGLLDIRFFTALIQQGWFAWPATTLAVAVALHATDVQPALIRGVRAVALALFSWLLPVLAVIVLGFLCSLPFVSLLPLWRTHRAAMLLLAAAGCLVFLINCAYQDGASEQTTSRIKRVAGVAGALELLPLTGLAAWALHLRVAQYGWTEERIFAAAVLLVAACYALVYAAAVPGRTWLKRLETGNVAVAYAIVALVLALYSPVADPARLMVADQMARLRSGAVTADNFDYLAVKFDGARWGTAALEQLVETRGGPQAEMLRTRAALALAAKSRFQPAALRPMTRVDALGRVLVYPAGQRLPDSFYTALIDPRAKAVRPFCLNAFARDKCIAVLLKLGPDTVESVLLIDGAGGRWFQQDSVGAWHQAGVLNGNLRCGAVLQALEDGTAAPVPHDLPDLAAGGARIVITPLFKPCPPPR